MNLARSVGLAEPSVVTEPEHGHELDRRFRELALALPEKVVLARPTGVGRAIATYDMPIEGRDEWLAAARRLA